MDNNPISDHDIEQALQDIRPLAEPGPGLRQAIRGRLDQAGIWPAITANGRELRHDTQLDPFASLSRPTHWPTIFAVAVSVVLVILLVGILRTQERPNTSAGGNPTPGLAGPSVTPPSTVVGHIWDLVEIDGEVPPPGMLIEFPSARQYVARGLCRTIWGGYDDSAGTIGRIYKDYEGPDCTDEMRVWSERYLREIDLTNSRALHASHVELRGDRLALYNELGVRMLRFRYHYPENPTPTLELGEAGFIPATIAGTQWDLVEINGEEPPPGMTMKFLTNGEYDVYAVCTTVWGNYDEAAGAISYIYDVGGDAKCTDDMQIWSTRYINAIGHVSDFGRVVRFELEEDRLILYNSLGTPTLRFRYHFPAASIPTMISSPVAVP